MDRIGKNTGFAAIEMEPASGLLVHELGTLALCDEGGVLELALTLKAVPPEIRVALALELAELDESGRGYPRGLRTFLVPAHHGTEKADLDAGPFRFILPAELDVSRDGLRRFRVRADCHYVDYHARCDLPQNE